MKVIKVAYDLQWMPKPNKAEIILSSQSPPLNLITSAFILAFQGDALLMPRSISRGWDLPGGHIDLGETPLEAMHRETFEEAYAYVEGVRILAYQKIEILADKPAAYKYPYPVSYQLFYWGKIMGLEPFQQNGEQDARKLFAPPEARKQAWVQDNLELYEAALSQALNS